ncbi:hypothetical protein [Vreelandella subglaciescola]|jgi:hypothetical protein|uniref:Uncharacterized protein n=1 Tax=Vreelandella subglaciescola TaxID=29571 RepID=A0A1M7I7F5_9GAMM|nr:hypothetical protein [Halomonas subglaciescola]SHM36377.1 hypothetical protein SAMN05878437_2585 [Halomonas subglaciescola]
MKNRFAKSTPLTHFARNATAEQKQALRNKVISNAIARQKRVLEQANEQH